MSMNLRRRMAALEARLAPEDDLPTLFVSIVGASDPDHPHEPRELGDLIGAYATSTPLRVSARPGETPEQLQQRAAASAPDVRAWMFAYATHRERFDACAEVGA